jgi:hypothetical protein
VENVFVLYGRYSIFDTSNKQNTTTMETNRNTIKTWTLNIPFANTAGRNNAKKLGATWNPNTKMWTVETSEYKLDLRNLWKFVATESANVVNAEKTTVDSGAGFAMENTVANRRLVNKYGFDAIEMI